MGDAIGNTVGRRCGAVQSHTSTTQLPDSRERRRSNLKDERQEESTDSRYETNAQEEGDGSLQLKTVVVVATFLKLPRYSTISTRT